MPPERTEDEWNMLGFQASRVFTPAAPVDEKSVFAGRARQVGLAIDAVNQKGRHAILYGERGVGKTSLANVLHSFIETPQWQIVASKVNCDSNDTFSSLWHKVFREVALSDPTAGFHEKKRLARFDEKLPSEISPAIVRECLTLLSRVAPNIIIIIDEFDRRQKGVDQEVADTIKMLSDYAVSATIILVGVADSVDSLIQEHESIERALVQIQVPRMSSSELGTIVDRGLTALGLEIGVDARRRILRLSQGLPHYTHLLGLHSARAAIAIRTEAVTMAHVDAAIRQAIADVSQSAKNAYVHAVSSSHKGSLFRQVLLACALAETDELGFFMPRNVRGPMTAIMGKPYDIPNFARHLAEFASERRGEILRKAGKPNRYRFRFKNPLMKPFVVLKGLDKGLVTDETLEELGVGDVR